MKTIDIILLIILLFGAFKGFQKGLLMEIVSILALILGIVGGFKLLHQGMIFLDNQFDINGSLLPFLSFILIFILIVILVNLLGKSIKKIIDMTLLGSFDNLVGSLVGILKWAFGISAIIWIANSFHLGLNSSMTEGAFIYPVVEGFAPTVINGLSAIFPFLEDFVQTIGDFISTPAT